MKAMASRREILGSSAALATAGMAALANPGAAAAQTVGVKAGDLPDLTVKEVRCYVTDIGNYKSLNGETGEIVSIITNSGIEGLYTLGNRNRTPGQGWVDWAKATLVGKSVVDLLPALASTSGLKSTYGFNGQMGDPKENGRYTGAQTFGKRGGVGDESAFVTPALQGSGLVLRGGGAWPNWYRAAADVCLWDIMGKAVNRPIYQILHGGVGAQKKKLIAYASSTHHAHIEDYAPEALKAKSEGFRAYKIHPGTGAHRKGADVPAYLGHIEEAKQIRAAVGDEYILAHDPVMMYNRYEAMKVARALDDLDFSWFEDPLRTDDQDGLIELCRYANLPIHVGEFIYSIADFAEYIAKGALDVVRLIADNTGGISGSMRVGLLADAFGLECTPHNWGNPMDLAVHFHLELALPNASWFEVPYPAEIVDHPYMPIKYRPDKDGYIHAPTAPGLGVPIDRAAFDRATKQILR